MAHRLHRRQGIYRFNLYNECNLFLLPATCFPPGANLSEASVDERGGGNKMRWMSGCMDVVCECVDRNDDVENIGRGTERRQEVERRERFMWRLCWCPSCRYDVVQGRIIIAVHPHAAKRGHRWLMCVMGNSRLCSLFSIYSVSSSSLAFTILPEPEEHLLLFPYSSRCTRSSFLSPSDVLLMFPLWAHSDRCDSY